jgi:hypothetical protein
MLQRFFNGTIVSRIAGETLKNNDIYIVDPEKQNVRKPTTPDEWLTCQLVYVCNAPEWGATDTICAGSACRCWIGYLII